MEARLEGYSHTRSVVNHIYEGSHVVRGSLDTKSTPGTHSCRGATTLRYPSMSGITRHHQFSIVYSFSYDFYFYNSIWILVIQYSLVLLHVLLAIQYAVSVLLPNFTSSFISLYDTVLPQYPLTSSIQIFHQRFISMST